MDFVGWTFDLAREQSAHPDRLKALLSRSRNAGYNALGLYLEHRFAYRTAPWAAAEGCLTPNQVATLQRQARSLGLRLIPFLNTLGHMEGFIRAEGGQWLAEGPSPGALSLQMCPTRPECRTFARGLVEDALSAFDDEWVHLGGDETRQLGQCPACAPRLRQAGKGGLYGEYFGDLCRWVLSRGRRPCLWADMVLAHPEALEQIPKQTVLFDWQYERGAGDSAARLRQRGFDVVCCPALHTFDSGWCYWDLTRENVDEQLAAAEQHGALGVCLTTWEFSGFSQCESVFPLVFAVGRRMGTGDHWGEALSGEGGVGFADAAEILGEALPAAAPFLLPGGRRKLRERLVIRGDPFLLWSGWRSEACGQAGTRVLELCRQAEGLVPEKHALRFAIDLHRVSVEWVRLVERAYERYQARDAAGCAGLLEGAAALFDRLRPGLLAEAERGGSRADPARLDRLIEHVARVRQRLAALPTGAGFMPSFATLTHEHYVPGDQGAWGTG